MLELKFTTQEYSTKKSCLLNHNRSLFFTKILTHTNIISLEFSLVENFNARFIKKFSQLKQ